MADETRKSKDRSPNFPFIPLVRALQRAQEFYNNERRGPAPFAVAASHWGYSPTSSGSLQTAAALKSYGLIVDEGTGPSRKLRLSELALRILLDQRPDNSERLAYIRQAAMMPPVAAEIYKKFPNELPSDPTLNHLLVLEMGFNQGTAIKVVEILKHNQKFVGNSSQNTISSDDGIEYGETTEESNMNTGQPMPQMISPQSVPSPAIASGPVKQERVIAPDAEVLLQFHGVPTWETYDFLEKYIALRKSVLKKPI